MYKDQMVSNPDPRINEKVVHWISPMFLLLHAVYYWVLTLLTLPLPPYPSSLQELRHRAFSRLWLAKGRAMSEEMPGRTVELIRSARGRVLDIGPGSGEQLHRFTTSDKQISELWGVEPATDLHPRLIETASLIGLKERFHALECGAEPESLVPALAREGLIKHGQPDVFDDICLVRVLCGVPHPQETIQGLYRLLKPGGRFIICEHVVNPWPNTGHGSPIGRFAQAFWQHVGGWKYLMGGCQLNRNSKHMLLEAATEDGGWAKVDMQWVNPWAAVPFIVGTLTKKSKQS